MIKKRFKNKQEKDNNYNFDNSFSISNDKEIITGIYSISKNGDFGFIDIVGQDKGFFVFNKNKKDAMSGDEVEAYITEYNGKKEAVITKILKRSNNIVVGKFIATKSKSSLIKNNFSRDFSYGFVIPGGKYFSRDIFVGGKNLKEVADGDIVSVKILKFDGKSPEGEILEILGKDNDKGIDVDTFIAESGFRQTFKIKIDYELKNFTSNIPNSELEKRVDLRKLFTFTIDGEDARDLDDAISIVQRQNGNYELYVHIADVVHYVNEKSELDKEAFKRGTSVYLADRVIPMLPEKLSNDLCSLNPDTDKLTLTCEMLISKDGQIRKSKVYESVIRSDFRLTYKEVDYINENKELKELFCKKNITKQLIDTIKNAEILRSYLSKNSQITGVLDFDFPETKIELDSNNNPIGIKEYPKYKSNKIIEEFMISANHSISKQFANLPFLHRIHPKPSEDDINKLQSILNLFGVNFSIKNLTTKDFSNLLSIIYVHKSKIILEKTILRSLAKAIYSHENEGHFGLGLDYYSHFTSPIRRYPDLQIHRIIKEKLHKKLDESRISHYHNILKEVANNCSTQERKAEKLEYKVRDYFIVKYYSDKIGLEFSGIIVSVLERGIFVQLKDTAEGFIDLKERKGFYYNEDLMRFDDKKNDKIYNIGDEIKVKLIEADMNNLKLIFDFLA